ncbi:hypothetical protein RB195_014408 [Necator americanus]|uniref:Headcase N-terminal domain-containing protein n=1 Tax=Necator americanus TaxID=51031 RepID=A0ABR1DZW4_NECAM
MGSARKHDKARGKDKDNKATSAHPVPLIPKICGCPVPDPIRCFVGEPLPLGGDGVRMECSNEKCPFTDVLLHQECFDAFEDHLVKVLSNLGSARGWTDAQRRANLWDKKGQSLIAKVCRCRCGLGMTKMDELAAYDRLKRKAREEAEAQREAALAAGLRTPPHKKKHRNKNALPKLNFGLVKVPSKPHQEEREPRGLTRRHGAKPRDVSTSSISSTLTSHVNFESRRESLTYASDAWGLLPAFATDNRAHSVMSGHFADQDDSISSCSKDYSQDPSNSVELLLTSLPRNTMSYASIMKNGATSPHEHPHMSSHPFATAPLGVQTEMTVSDSGVELKSGSTSSSEFSELMSNKDPTSPLKEDMMTVPSLTSLHFGCQDDDLLAASLIDFDCLSTESFGGLDLRPLSSQQSPPGSSDAYAECLYTRPNDCEITSIPEWNLFRGTSFCLGESIVANTFLPVWGSARCSRLPKQL